MFKSSQRLIFGSPKIGISRGFIFIRIKLSCVNSHHFYNQQERFRVWIVTKIRFFFFFIFLLYFNLLIDWFRPVNLICICWNLIDTFFSSVLFALNCYKKIFVILSNLFEYHSWKYLTISWIFMNGYGRTFLFILLTFVTLLYQLASKILKKKEVISLLKGNEHS